MAGNDPYIFGPPFDSLNQIFAGSLPFGEQYDKDREQLRKNAEIITIGKAEALSKGSTVSKSSSYLGGLFSTSQISETGKEKSSAIEAGKGTVTLNPNPTNQPGIDAGKDKPTGTTVADNSNAFSSILSGLSGVLMPLIIIIALFLVIKLVK